MTIRCFVLGLAVGLVIGCGDDDGPGSPDSGNGQPDAAMTDAATDDAGGDDAGGDDAALMDAGVDAAVGLTVEAFCAGFYQAVCEWNAACRTLGAVTCDFPYADDLLQACAGFAGREAAGTLSFDPAAAGRCLEQNFAACGSPRPFDTVDCLGAFVGHVAPGDDCYQPSNRAFDNECQAGSYCDVRVSACPGTCVAARTVGQSCGGSDLCDSTTVCTDSVCQPRSSLGDACDTVACRSPFSCISNVCRLSVGLGEACSETSPCTNTLVCHAGTCANSVPSGAECDRDPLCPSGELCLIDGAGPDRRCQLPLSAGATCDPAGDERQCGIGGVCQTESEPPVSQCVAPGVEGDSCASVACATGFWCRFGGSGDDVGGTCRAGGALNESCATTGSPNQTRCAAGLQCSADVCVALLSDGTACGSAAECVSRTCRPDANAINRCGQAPPASTCARPL